MKTTITVTACIAALVATTLPASADDTGLAAALHTLRREGGRICQQGHFHNGNSAGQPSKAIALKSAIGFWSSFTALEYGSDWASFKKAGSKSVTCTQSGGGWSCDVNARPCR
jgi:hypothetical protein